MTDISHDCPQCFEVAGAISLGGLHLLMVVVDGSELAGFRFRQLENLRDDHGRLMMFIANLDLSSVTAALADCDGDHCTAAANTAAAVPMALSGFPTSKRQIAAVQQCVIAAVANGHRWSAPRRISYGTFNDPLSTAEDIAVAIARHYDLARPLITSPAG